MKSTRARGMFVLMALVMMGAIAPAMALEKLRDGVYTLNPEAMDDLLEMGSIQDLRVLVIDDTSAKATSEAHAQAIRAWVEKGGVVWVQGEAAESTLVALLTQRAVKVEEYNFQKATTGKKGGELIVRGASDRLVIHEHPITEGVERLYVNPARSFEATRGLRPILEMTDSEGNHGVVMGSLPVGRGHIVLDGTRQTRGFSLAFWRSDFDKDHPHAVKQDDEWESYDWEKLLENAISLADRSESPRT